MASLDVDAEAWTAFAAGHRGAVRRLDAADCDEAHAVWNGMIDRRPALIARCPGVADVRHAVACAREHRRPGQLTIS